LNVAILKVSSVAGVFMPDRDSLHKLVDSLPEAAVGVAEKLLKTSQTWHHVPPVDVPAMRRRVREMLTRGPGNVEGKRLNELLDTRGSSGGFGRPASSFRSGMDREASWFVVEGETLVTFRICRRHGHELEIEERFRVCEKGGTLHYSQHVKGPNGKTDTYEIAFECR
jgi:hypothetical protein